MCLGMDASFSIYSILTVFQDWKSHGPDSSLMVPSCPPFLLQYDLAPLRSCHQGNKNGSLPEPIQL